MGFVFRRSSESSKVSLVLVSSMALRTLHGIVERFYLEGTFKGHCCLGTGMVSAAGGRKLPPLFVEVQIAGDGAIHPRREVPVGSVKKFTPQLQLPHPAASGPACTNQRLCKQTYLRGETPFAFQRSLLFWMG